MYNIGCFGNGVVISPHFPSYSHSRWLCEYKGDLDEKKEFMVEVMAGNRKEMIELTNGGDGHVPENGYIRQRRSVFGYDSQGASAGFFHTWPRPLSYS